MLPEEYAAAAELAGQGFGSFVRGIRETHGAIAARVFGYVGQQAKPVALAHDAISELAYSSTGALGSALLKALGFGAALSGPDQAASMERSPAGRIVKGALSGIYGDRLAEQGSALAAAMAVRAHGADVEATPSGLAAAFPGATPKLAVFLHGLCETEDAWWLGAGRSPTYGERLRDELGYTPVYIRYNSGLHVSANGRSLAELLGDVVGGWPVEVDQIALIGHSMGGLISRSACHYGDGATWTGKVAHVFMLGTPHLGAPLEQAVHAASCALARLPETRPVATALNARSVGIKDLGRGYITDECWGGQDPDAYLRHAAREIPFLETANHYFIAASLLRDPDHRFGRHVGDLLVLHASAWGSQPRGERMRFPVDHYRHYGGATHFDLLNHPAIGDQIVRWLSPRALLSAGEAA